MSGRNNVCSFYFLRVLILSVLVVTKDDAAFNNFERCASDAGAKLFCDKKIHFKYLFFLTQF